MHQGDESNFLEGSIFSSRKSSSKSSISDQEKARILSKLIEDVRIAHKQGKELKLLSWCREHGLNRSLMREYYAFAKGYVTCEEGVEADPTSLEYARVMHARKASKLGVNEFRFYSMISEALQEVAGKIEPVPKYPQDFGKLKKTERRDKEVLVLLFGDWHYGQVIRSENVGGVNEYNETIAEERLHRLVERAVYLKELLHPDTETLLVVGLGDIVHGDQIYPTIAWESACVSIEQILRAGNLIANVLSFLSSKFKRVVFTGIGGNHGRTTRKRDALPYAANNDILTYEFAKARLEGRVENVEFFLPRSRAVILDIAGTMVVAHHGDLVSGSGGFGGIPVYSLRRMFVGLADAIREPIRYQFVGHRHVPMSALCTIQNGCISGVSPYEFERGYVTADSRIPSQKLLTFHPDYGLIRQEDIYLENPKEANEKRANIFRIS
jgi:hypothetical protein